MKKIAYVGIDYHQNTLSIAVSPENKEKIRETIRIRNEDKVIKKYMKKLSAKYRIKPVMKPLQAGITFKERWNHGATTARSSPLPHFLRSAEIVVRMTFGMPGI